MTRVEACAIYGEAAGGVDPDELEHYCDEKHTGLPRDPLKWTAVDFMRACAFGLVRKYESEVIRIERVEEAAGC